MRAAHIAQFGDIDRLEIVDQPVPEVGSEQVLIKVEACGLNVADILQRQGLYFGGARPPYVPGIEAAGSVVAVGENSTVFKIGDRITGLAKLGLHAEYALVLRDASLPLLDSISAEVGAAIPVHYVTAYYSLVNLARAVEGETVLIHAAGGGLGMAAIQIAKVLGLKVIGTSSTEEKRRHLEALGVDVVTDYVEFDRATRAFTNNKGCDIILESIGGSIFKRSVNVLRPLGRVIFLGMSGKEAPVLDPVKMLYRSYSVHGFHLNNLVPTPKVIRGIADTIMEWIAAGKINVHIGHRFPLSEIREAHRLVEERGNYGKVVLIP